MGSVLSWALALGQCSKTGENMKWLIELVGQPALRRLVVAALVLLLGAAAAAVPLLAEVRAGLCGSLSKPQTVSLPPSPNTLGKAGGSSR